MKIPVIRIGNSKGIRLSKTILERYRIRDDVELILEDEQIVIRSIASPRTGWEEAFMEMHRDGGDELLIDDVFGDEDIEEWK